MIKPLSFVALFVLLECNIALAQTVERLASRVQPSVVTVITRDKVGNPLKLGSGFFVGKNLIATNYHVITDAIFCSVRSLGSKGEYEIDGVAAVDKVNDLAVLQVRGLLGPPLPLVASREYSAGSQLYVFGSPKGLEGTVSSGIVSSSELRRVAGRTLLQISAPISAGSSGGPVVNSQGQVIGVAVSVLADGQNLNFAVPASFLNSLLQGRTGSLSGFSSLGSGDSDGTPQSEGPSYEETVDWLTKTIRDLHDNPGTMVESLSLNNCTLTFQYSTPDDSSSKWRRREFTRAELLHATKIYASENGVQMEFGDRRFAASSTEKYLDGQGASGTPLSITTDILWFFTRDATTATRVAKAMNHLVALCRNTQSKEPF